MTGGLIRLAGIVMCIWCLFVVMFHLSGFSENQNWPLYAIGLLVGLLIFATGRIIADLFGGSGLRG